jgi:hypothetical protein
MIRWGAAAAVSVLWALGYARTAAGLELQLPVSCAVGLSCHVQNYVDSDPSPGSRDYRCGTRTYDGHNGTDFRLPSMKAQRAGVDVVAAASGRVARARDGVPDISVRLRGLSEVQGQECGNALAIDHGDGWETQYCHMARGSLRVRPGDQVHAGQPIGQIGLSGLTEYPHLHFTVRQQGKVVDPFAVGAPGGACGVGDAIWSRSDLEKLAYRPRSILNTGFAPAPITMELLEEGSATVGAPSPDWPALIAFVRTIGAKRGDVQKLAIRAPDGTILAEASLPPLDRDKAQVLSFVGKKLPSPGWQRGTYEGVYSIVSDGRVVLEQTFRTTL